MGLKSKNNRPAKKRVGRRTLLTPEVQRNIVRVLREGNYPKTAYTLAGISEKTYYNWLGRGEDAHIKADAGKELCEEEKLYLQFLQAIKRAIETGIQRNLEIITAAAEGGFESVTTEILDPKTGKVIKRTISRTPPCWQASAWILERTRPGEFALRGRIDINENRNIAEEIKVEITSENAGSIWISW